MKKTLLVTATLAILFLNACTSGKGTSSEQESEKFTFAFLTDIHVEYEKNADKGFQQAIDHVNGLNPDFVITGGDLISDALGQTEQKASELYDLYIELAEGFNMPVYNTQGNHEEFGIYEKSGVSMDHELYGDKMYEKRIGERYYSFEHKGWRFYILDSVDETENRRYFGNIDSVQIDWLKKNLKSVDSGIPLVIVTHIPLLSTLAQFKEGSMKANSKGLVVGNSKEVLDLFSGHNLKLVLEGHLHELEHNCIRNIHFIVGGSVSARWWNGPIGLTEEGYVLVHVDGEDFDWEYIDYGWEVGL